MPVERVKSNKPPESAFVYKYINNNFEMLVTD